MSNAHWFQLLKLWNCEFWNFGGTKIGKFKISIHYIDLTINWMLCGFRSSTQLTFPSATFSHLPQVPGCLAGSLLLSSALTSYVAPFLTSEAAQLESCKLILAQLGPMWPLPPALPLLPELLPLPSPLPTCHHFVESSPAVIVLNSSNLT